MSGFQINTRTKMWIVVRDFSSDTPKGWELDVDTDPKRMADPEVFAGFLFELKAGTDRAFWRFLPYDEMETGRGVMFEMYHCTRDTALAGFESLVEEHEGDRDTWDPDSGQSGCIDGRDAG